MSNAELLEIEAAWRFVELLAGLSPDEWRHADRRPRDVLQADVATLRRLAGGHRASLIAWCLEDGIDTAAWLAGHRRADHGSLRARVAALAVLLRAPLGERRFRVLYGPFERVIPEDRVFSGASGGASRLYEIFVRRNRRVAQRSRDPFERQS